MTDGVVEAADAQHNLFGRQRTIQMFVESQESSLEESIREIENALTTHQGPTAAMDDITLLVLEIAPLAMPNSVASSPTHIAPLASRSIRRIS